MKVSFKTSELNSPLEIFEGLGINTFGSNPKKLDIKSINITSSSDTVVNVYMQANDLATNSKTTRHIAYKMDVAEGEILQVIDKQISLTTEYSIYISKVERDGSDVDVYFEFDEVDDAPFVNSFNV